MRNVATLWLMLLLASRALAQPGPAVSVTRAAGADDCPDTAALLARIELLRGRPDAGATVRYQVSFTRDNAGFRAEIRAGSDAGSARVLHDQAITCAGLEQATAVTVALLLDSDARASTTPTPPAAVKPVAASSNAAQRVVDRPTWVERLRRDLSGPRDVTFSLGGAGLVGVLRPIAPALNADVGVRLGNYRTDLGVLWSPGLSTDLAPGSVRVALWSAETRSCYALVLAGPVRVDLCSAFYLGAMLASAQGYDQNQRETRFWAACALELALASTPEPLGWELSASALVPFRRQDFAIDRVGVVYESRQVGALVSLRGVALWSL